MKPSVLLPAVVFTEHKRGRRATQALLIPYISYRIEYVSTGRYEPLASFYWTRHLCSLDSASTVF